MTLKELDAKRRGLELEIHILESRIPHLRGVPDIKREKGQAAAKKKERKEIMLEIQRLKREAKRDADTG